MPRQKKEAKILNINLAASVYNDLEQFCTESGFTKTVVVEKAIAAYLEDCRKKQELLKKLESK